MCTIKRLSLLSVVLYPRIVLANFIWPPAMMYAGVKSWWIVPVTLGIEFLFYRFGIRLPTRQAILLAVVANLASAVVGLLTVDPFFANGIAWMFAFRGAPRLAIIFLAPVALGFINAVIEGAIARYVFAVPIGGKRFLALAGINTLTTIITIAGNLVGIFSQ